MTKQMCVEFLTHTVAELSNQVSKQFHNFEENKSINELFSTYDSDLDGRLTKADFLKFYTDKSNSAPDKVW
jgi:Ca2+-binding EF-hand superfamily protein